MTVTFTRLGHAALLVETAQSRLLIDPGAFSEPEAFALTGLDAIVVTHRHPDHYDPERGPGLLGSHPDIPVLADAGAAEAITASLPSGHAGLRTFSPDDEARVGDLTLRGVGGAHALISPLVPRISNTGVLILADDGPTIFHPGDSFDATPPADVLCLPVGSPWSKVSEMVEFARAVAATTTLPIHEAALSRRGFGVHWPRAVEAIESLGDGPAGPRRAVEVAPTGGLRVDASGRVLEVREP